MEDNTTQLTQGDKVKSFNKEGEGYELEPYYRAVVKDINHEEGTAEILYLEKKRKGEIRTESLDDLKPLKQKTWMCMIGTAYAVDQNKNYALRKALTYFKADRVEDDTVTVWMAEVDQNNWSIRGLGQVYSTFIDNDEEFEVNTDLAERIKGIESDVEGLTENLMAGEEPAERYLQEVTRR